MRRARAIYSTLLYCYPAPFRQEYGRQMCSTFAQQLRDARQTGAWRSEAAVWIASRAGCLHDCPQGALACDCSRPARCVSHDDSQANVLIGRHHVARSRHRRQHCNLWTLEQRVARSASRRCRSRGPRDAHETERVGDVARSMECSHRRAPGMGQLCRVRAATRPRGRFLVTDGLSKQPDHLAGPRRGWNAGGSTRAPCLGNILRGAGRTASDWPPVHSSRGPKPSRARGTQSRVLAATVRRTLRRAR